ncbi:MAG: hypothetical protein IJ125_02715 [Atopobiaceae bacterium]|nr:hypothetical protein [Atopobiaceae bacterium]
MSATLVVNHRVALRSTKELKGVVGHTVSYIATREGVVIEPTADDILRQESGFLDYMSERPGAVVECESGLFDAEGIVDVAEVRRELEASGSAVVTSVVSVRRADGPELGLCTRQDFERYLRANWAPALAHAMGIPEERVGWIAAFHLNSPESYHAHVITYDREGRFNHTLDRHKMEQARQQLTDAAIAPALCELSRERTLVRDDCVRICRSLEASELERAIQLPQEGSLKYEWLCRNHPEVASQIEQALARLSSQHSQLKASEEKFRALVEKAACLKGLEAQEKDSYIAQAMSELHNRQCNALLKAMRPDRSLKAERRIVYDPDAPTPARDRRLSKRFEEELSALSASDKKQITSAIQNEQKLPDAVLEKCVTWKSQTSTSPNLKSALNNVQKSLGKAPKTSQNDSAELATKKALKLTSRLMVRAISLANPQLGQALRIVKTLSHVAEMSMG